MRQTRLSLKTPAEEGPTVVDQHVGRRLRARRKAIGMSQTALADASGVTFQQIQKYERATNRVSASRLFTLGEVLGVEPAYFFDGLERVTSATGPLEGSAAEWLTTDEAETLAMSMAVLPPSHRGMVIKLAQVGCALAMMSQPTPDDTPETVAAKAKVARQVVASLARGIH